MLLERHLYALVFSPYNIGASLQGNKVAKLFHVHHFLTRQRIDGHRLSHQRFLFLCVGNALDAGGVASAEVKGGLLAVKLDVGDGLVHKLVALRGFVIHDGSWIRSVGQRVVLLEGVRIVGRYRLAVVSREEGEERFGIVVVHLVEVPHVLVIVDVVNQQSGACLLYTSPSPRD